jgi:hypothetical protein
MSRHPVIDRSDPQTDTNLRAAILSIGNILHVGGMPDSVVDHLLDRARMTLTPAQRLDPSSAYTTQVLGQITGFVKETYGLDRLLNIHGPAGRPGADAGTADAGSFFDARGLTRLDRLGAGSVGAYFGHGYSSLNTRWDPSSGAAGLTAANFASTDFARAGLDLSTTRLLFGQGFTPTQILQAASLTNELGIDVKGNVAAVARLTRDVKGAAASLRTMRDFQNQIDAEEEKARLARERGDHTAAAEHEKKAEDARRRQKEFEDRERARIQRENPDRVGDWDRTIEAIKGKGERIEADLKAGRITQEQADEQRKALMV